MSVTNSGSGGGAAYDSGALTTTITGPTIPSGSNRYLLVAVGGWDGGNTGTPTVTFGGASMTQLIHEQGSGAAGQHLQLFGFVSPTVGSGNNIVVTFPATSWHVGITWDVYLGVGSTATAVSNWSNTTGPATVGVDGLDTTDLIAGGFIQWGNPTANISPGTGVTQRNVGDNSAGDGETTFSGDEAVILGTLANTFSFSWTGVASTWSIAALELQGAAGVAITGAAGTGSPGTPGDSRSILIF